NVIDDRRASVQSHHGREGRLDPWIAALAFERFHQRGFFAALVSACPGVRQQIEIESRSENILPQVAARICFGESSVHDIQHVAVFAENISESLVRTDGTSCNPNTFDYME